MFRQVPPLALLWSDDAMTKRKSQAPTMASRLELWPLERLKPFERNARTHSEQQLRQLVASLQEFGFTAPILVDGQDGILAGHGRLEAARRLGLAQVPVVVLDHLTPEQRRAYVIADNRLAENAGWDMSVLQAELEALRVEDFDLDALGWSDDALARLQDDLDLGSFEGVAAAAGTERVEPERQEALGLGPAGEDDDDADATAESGEVEERHVFSVNLLWDDRESLLAAVRMAKERWGLEGTPEALVAICREWMDGRSGV
jgi:ParB-like chromosome segregation protein Spo0J